MLPLISMKLIYTLLPSISKESANNLQTELLMPSEQIRGYSTTTMASANTDFSSNMRALSIIIRYSYQEHHWNYADIAGGGPSKSFLHDLETFPQNKAFRKAVGMEG